MDYHFEYNSSTKEKAISHFNHRRYFEMYIEEDIKNHKQKPNDLTKFYILHIDDNIIIIYSVNYTRLNTYVQVISIDARCKCGLYEV